MNREQRRRLERAKERALRRLERGQTHYMDARMTMTMRHAYRLVRDGRVVAQYGEVPDEREDN